jgi:hypothetical protein
MKTIITLIILFSSTWAYAKYPNFVATVILDSTDQPMDEKPIIRAKSWLNANPKAQVKLESFNCEQDLKVKSNKDQSQNEVLLNAAKTRGQKVASILSKETSRSTSSFEVIPLGKNKEQPTQCIVKIIATKE